MTAIAALHVLTWLAVTCIFALVVVCQSTVPAWCDAPQFTADTQCISIGATA